MMEHGIINSVNYRDGVPICSVQPLDRVDVEHEAVPVMRSHHGFFLVPEQDQTVQMLTIDEQRFIVGILDRGADYANPTLKPGEAAFQFDDETTLSFTKNSDGSHDVTISASGDVHIDAAGDVYIDGIDFDAHTHEYTDSTTDTSTTKTTEPPE